MLGLPIVWQVVFIIYFAAEQLDHNETFLSALFLFALPQFQTLPIDCIHSQNTSSVNDLMFYLPNTYISMKHPSYYVQMSVQRTVFCQ